MTATRFWQAAFLGCLVTITWLSLASHEQLPSINIWDKLSHTIAYAALGLLAHFGWPKRSWLRDKLIPLAVYGMLIEMIQSFIPGRECSLLDITANALGLLLAVLIMQGIRLQRQNQYPR